MVVGQGDGVAVLVAEDAAGVAHVGHGQLLVGQEGDQTRGACTTTGWGQKKKTHRGCKGLFLICRKSFLLSQNPRLVELGKIPKIGESKL